MAVLARVTGRGYYGRKDGNVVELPVGHEIVLRGVPAAMKNKLEVVREVADSNFKVADSPEGAKLRAEGESAKADKMLDAQREEIAKKLSADAAKTKAAKADAAKAAKAAEAEAAKADAAKDK